MDDTPSLGEGAVRDLSAVRKVELGRREGFVATAHLQSGRSQSLVVTFGDIRSGLAAEGFGTTWALLQGHDTVHIAQRPRSQYQQLSRGEFLRVMTPIARDYDRVVTYGSSVGGYAAIYFGGAMGCDIVAAAPRLPMHPILSAPRFRKLPLLHERELPVPEPSQVPPIVLFDPLNLTDSRFLFQYAGPRYPRMHIVSLPGAGHNVLETLKRTGYLSRVMSPLIAGRGTRPRPWLLSEVRKAIASLAASKNVPSQKLVQSRPEGGL